jgi:hypothetical protein
MVACSTVPALHPVAGLAEGELDVFGDVAAGSSRTTPALVSITTRSGWVPRVSLSTSRSLRRQMTRSPTAT